MNYPFAKKFKSGGITETLFLEDLRTFVDSDETFREETGIISLDDKDIRNIINAVKQYQPSRRTFLRWLGIGIGTAAAHAIGLKTLPAFAKVDTHIPVIASGHQQYLNKVVAKMPTQFVDDVTYDPDHSATIKQYGLYKKRMLEDQGLYDLYKNQVPDLPKTFKFGERERRKFYENRVSSWYDWYLEYIKNKKDLLMITLQYPYDFGKNKKSKVFAYSPVFEKQYIKEGNKLIELPTELKIMVQLYHEYVHARKMYYGQIGELKIPGYKRIGFNPYVLSLGEETDAYLETMEYTRQFGFTNEVHIYFIFVYFEVINWLYQNIQNQRISNNDKSLIDYVIRRIRETAEKYVEFRHIYEVSPIFGKL